MRKYDLQIKRSKSETKKPAEEASCVTPPGTAILGEPICESVSESLTIEAEKPEGVKSRLVSKSSKVYDLSVRIIEKEITTQSYVCDDEFVSISKKPDEIGPEKYRVTWTAMTLLISLAVTYCLPINRIATMLRNDFGVFQSGQISRLFRFVAELLLPIYIELADILSECSHLSGDDTRTCILYEAKPSKEDSDTKQEPEIIRKLNRRFGEAALRADGKGFKKTFNLTVVTAQQDKTEPNSWIVFFRSHLGDFGSLLSKIFTSRRRRKDMKNITIQSDRASWNQLTKIFEEMFDVKYAGCMSHARRPLWRHRHEYHGVCFYLLRAFAILSKIERELAESGASPDEVIKRRGRYSQKVWGIIINYCKQIVGKIPREERLKDIPLIPPDSPIYKAASYILNHDKELMHYLEDPFVFLTNNHCERLLRREKMILASSRFRRTPEGRATFDILKTFAATCTAANVKLRDYLIFVFKNRHDIESHPELYTPFEFAKRSNKQVRPAIAV